MRRNYVSVNAKYYTKKRLTKLIRHNLRKDDIDYLLENTKYKNENFVYGAERIKLAFDNSMDKKRKTSKAFKNSRDTDIELVEMVVALSEEQARYYLDNNIPLLDGYKQFMNDMKDRYGFEGLAINVHTDEGYVNQKKKINYNIHAHCTFHNFDFEKNKTVLRKLRKQDWRDMQDLAAQSFQKVGLNFVRGEAKLDNSKDHLERNDLIAQKQNNMINSQSQEITEQGLKLISERDELQKLILEKKNLKRELKAEYTNLNKIKVDTKVQRDEHEKNSLEYTTLNNNVKSLQKLEKDKRAEYRLVDNSVKQHINTKKSLENRIDNLDTEIAQKGLLSDELDTKNDELSKQIKSKKDTIVKDVKRANDIFYKKASAIVEKVDSVITGIDHKKLKVEMAREFKKMSNLDVNVESARKDRLEKNEIELEKKDIEKRYVQSLENNDNLEKSLKLEKQKHQQTKDNSISKDVINKVLENANMPSIEELEKQNEIKINLQNEQKSKSRNSMRHR